MSSDGYLEEPDDDQKVLARLYRIPLDMAYVIQGGDYAAKAEYARRMSDFLKEEGALAADVEFFRSASIDFDAWAASDQRERWQP